jgi:uncharacterized protein (TIRG00374 family)
VGSLFRFFQHPVVRVITTAGCLFMLLRSIDMSKAADAFLGASIGWLAAGLTLTFGLIVVQVLIWGVFLRCNKHDVPWGRLLSLYLQGLFWGHVLPGGVAGEAVRTVKLAKYTGEGDALASLAASRLVEGFGFMWLGVAAMIALPMWFGMFGFVAALLAAAVVGIAVFLLNRVDAIAKLVHSEGSSWRIRIAQLIGHFGEACVGYRQRPLLVVLALGLGVLSCSINLTALVCFSHAVGAPLSWSIFALVLPASAVTALAPFAINGFGLRESVVIALLAKVGVSAASAFAVAILIDFQLLPFAVIGAACYLLESRNK